MRFMFESNVSHRLMLMLGAFFFAFAGAGCSPEPAPKTQGEAQTFALSIINERFVERDGRWLALEIDPRNNPTRLIELNKPSIRFEPAHVSDTDRMNGVSERYSLSVFCEQFRYWGGSWTEWKTGTGGSTKAIVHAITAGTLGYQSYQLEKKKGEWVLRGFKPPALSTDRELIQQNVAKAFGPSL